MRSEGVADRGDRPRVTPIVCDWDASSRKPGTGYNGPTWHEILDQVEGINAPIFLNRRLGEVIPLAITSLTTSILEAGERPLLLGGDHRLSFSALQAITHWYGHGIVHQFDAHHDAHVTPTLNNYSVFHFVQKRFGLPIERYGCRELPVPAPIAHVRNPQYSYVTVDVDYLDPVEFSSVTFPETVPETMECTVATLTNQIETISHGPPILGCDLVEWASDRSTPAETSSVLTIVSALVDAMRDDRRTVGADTRELNKDGEN
ncbi:arginase family protein [Natronoglycomyces albus]|uniref:Arginase family protein n=1 Tax=Natronoglycomyces albus TaxID=2811108 RepID=A0A895XHE1_9ACTN|nr:arginase family protein [Natronoglycomyces albus]QSB04347.1 arginase family protein [Natronoglycomyces albus]